MPRTPGTPGTPGTTGTAHPPMHLPRALIFFASFWLIGSWMIAMGLRTPVHPNSASFTPGVRLMLLCIAVGMMIGWPLMRLSQVRSPLPIRQTLLDLAVILLLVQLVIWPLRLVTYWSATRTAAIDATLAGWLLIVGAIVASSIGTDRAGPRMLAMIACIGICLLGPALTAFGVFTGVQWIALIELSPLMAVHTLGQGGGTSPTDEQWRFIALLGVGAALLWCVVTMMVVMRGMYRSNRAN